MVFPDASRAKSGTSVLLIHLQVLSQQAEVQVEFLIPADRLLIISAGVGLGLLFLIIITVIMWKVSRCEMKSINNLDAFSSKIYFILLPSWAVSKGKVLMSLMRKTLFRTVLKTARRASASRRLKVCWELLQRHNLSWMAPRVTSPTLIQRRRSLKVSLMSRR